MISIGLACIWAKTAAGGKKNNQRGILELVCWMNFVWISIKACIWFILVLYSYGISFLWHKAAFRSKSNDRCMNYSFLSVYFTKSLSAAIIVEQNSKKERKNYLWIYTNFDFGANIINVIVFNLFENLEYFKNKMLVIESWINALILKLIQKLISFYILVFDSFSTSCIVNYSYSTIINYQKKNQRCSKK